jgi:hypothetical protein
MDEQRSKAVTEAFVRLHKEGLIYRLVSLHFLFECKNEIFHNSVCYDPLPVPVSSVGILVVTSNGLFIPFQRLSPC